MNAIEISKNDELRWNELLLNSINGSYRQSFPFEYAQELNNREVKTYIFQRNGIDMAGANYSIKGAYKNLITIADMLSGFVFREQPDHDFLVFLIEHFINWAKSKNISYIRLNPWLVKSIAGVSNQFSEFFDSTMLSFGFKNIEQGRNTYWIDLTKDEDIILNTTNKKARQNIRRAKLNGMEIEIYNNPNDDLLEWFWDLYVSRSNQKNIPVIKKNYMLCQVSNLMKSGLAKLYFAKFEEKMINVSLVSTFGQAASLHSGMNPEVNANKSIPSPGHFLRWGIIQDLKKIGNTIHDMGFCPGPVPIESHPQYGIWHFKYSFGGDHVEFLPTYGKALNPLMGKLFQYYKYKK